MARDVWFPFRIAVDAPSCRLVCVPPAGKGCSVFRRWPAAGPADVEILGVQFPGRETRLREPPVERVDVLAEGIAAALKSYTDRPLILFGHCFGAIVAFEVARRLAPADIQMLCISSSRPPDMVTQASRFADGRSDLEIMREAYGNDIADLPTELLDDLRVSLVADLKALDAYTYPTPATLPCPIHVFRWETDPTVSPAELEGWRGYSAAGFTQTLLQADRNALALQGAPILATIAAGVSSSTSSSSRVTQTSA